MRRTVLCWSLLLLCLSCLAFCIHPRQVSAADPAGQILNVFGQVMVKPGGAGPGQPAQVNQVVSAGDVVTTGSASGAAILFWDESQIKLNENTVFEIRQVAASPRLRLGDVVPAAVSQTAASLYGVSQGEVWLRNKNEKFRFEMQTPAVTAAIRGTEFNLRVGAQGDSILTMVEGQVQFANPQGQVVLGPGEEGVARPGQPPTKRLVLRPADAVQWSLYFPGVFSFRDIPLHLQGLPGASPALLAAADDYNQGRLEAARQAATAELGRQADNAAALTLLGWVSLQQNRPEETRDLLQRVQPANDASLVGLALARYRLNDLSGAYEAIHHFSANGQATPLLLTMQGYVDILVGRSQAGQRLLEQAVARAPDFILPRSLLTQVYLLQNRKDEARRMAHEILALAPNSPQALMAAGLVNIAFFDLPAAIRQFQMASDRDPRFVEPYLYLAKIWLGSDYLDRARRAVDNALALAPNNGEVLAMAGFVRLAFRDFAAAQGYFSRSVEASPGLGEPHLGLGICHFRYRRPDAGLTAMLKATLLEPHVALYQAELGKALYEARAFGKALDVYDYAKTLDPNDPTPYLYKGIALADLNRPGEAVQEINRSIALNDNRAVFRTRLGLNRDLAVRNYNLARSYNQLGLQEWATSKAVTAVGFNPLNSSAHLFLLNSYDTSSINGQSGQLLAAQNAEALLFRVLSLANQNTFNNIRIRPFTINTPDLGLGFDYTPLFEMPYVRMVTQAGAGAWEGSKAIQDYTGLGYGGLPGLAFYLLGNYTDDRGFRPHNGDSQGYNGELAVKWEPTVKGTFTGFFQYADTEAGDRNNLNDAAYIPVPHRRSFLRFRSMELSYVHHFNPQATFIAYFARKPLELRVVQDSTLTIFPFVASLNTAINIDRDINNFQVQQHLVLGNHTFIAGADLFQANYTYRQLLTITIPGLISLEFPFRNQPPERAASFYLLDYWRLSQNVLLELGVLREATKTPRAGFNDAIYSAMWSPRLGVNVQLNGQHTLRLALQRHLNTHYVLQPLLISSQLAGIPWLIDSDNGSEVRQAGAAWEAQWNPSTFTVVRFDAIRVATPNLANDPNNLPYRLSTNWQRYQGSLTLNRILSPAWGLSAGLLAKRVVPDLSLEDTVSAYWELDPFLRLAYLHKNGWLGRLGTFWVYQKLKNRADGFYPQVNLLLGKELAKKRGLVSFEVDNLFNRRAYYALEPGRSPEFYPARRFLVRLASYFL